VCPEHGIFEQLPDHHKRGSGCPICSKHYGDFNKKNLYVAYDFDTNMMKIGVSKNPERRIKDILKGYTNKNIKLLEIFKGKANLENKLHKYYSLFRKNHPVYTEGKTEWFELNKNELENIKLLVENYVVGLNFK